MEELLNNFSHYLDTNPLLAVFLVFVAGVGTGFTPCTYPLIPITIGMVGASAVKSRLRGFLLSLFYVAGFALVYAALGLIASLTGQMFGAALASPWVYFAVGNFFLYFGLALLEVVPIPFLKYLTSSADTAKLAGKGLLHAPILGGVSALVVGGCTAPILGALLTYVAVKGNVFMGGLMLFVFAFGMGVILILVGTFTGLIAHLPKSGRWLELVPKIFAVLFLLIAEYFFVKAGQLWF